MLCALNRVDKIRPQTLLTDLIQCIIHNVVLMKLCGSFDLS